MNYEEDDALGPSLMEANWKEPYSYGGESLLKKLGRSAATGIAHAPDILGLPGSLAEMVASKISGQDVDIPYLPDVGTFRKARQALAEKFLPDKDYLEPNDTMSQIASYIGNDLPFIVASGGAGALKSLLSSGTMVGAEKAGVGDIGQMILGGLASGGVDYVRHGGLAGMPLKAGQKERVGGIKTLTDFSDFVKHKAYGKAMGAGKKVKINAEPLEDYLINTLDTAGRRLTDTEYKALKAEIDTLSKDILAHQMTGDAALDARSKFNRLASEAASKGHSELAVKYEGVNKYIRNMVGEGSKSSKAYGKFVSQGDEIIKAINNQGKLRSWLEHATSFENTNPMTKMLLMGTGAVTGGLLGYHKGALPAVALSAAGGAGLYGAGLAAREAARTAQLIYRSPAIRKQFAKIMGMVAKDQMKMLPFQINKLDKEVTKLVGNGMPFTLEDVD